MAGTEHDPPGPALESTLVVPEPRTIAGKYKLGRMLGEGGMGSVYEAEHVGLAKRVAVKLLAENYAEDEVFVKRFKREARAMAAVTHENIVGVTDNGEDEEGVPFIVMELLDGESLASIIRRERVLPTAKAADIAGQVLMGLAAAHKKKIIHRDLKPANVFIAKDDDGKERAKVLDFGISKYAADVTNLNVTAEGAVIGTPAYMSPEQVKGRSDIDRRTDIYAVGVMLYRMLTGKLPFAGKKPRQIYDKILRGDATHPREHRTDIPRDLAKVVLKAMNVRKIERYETAEDFFDDLKAAVPDMETTGPLGVITRSGSYSSQYPPGIVDETAPTREAKSGPSSNATTGKLSDDAGPSRNGLIMGLIVIGLLGVGIALISRSDGTTEEPAADAGGTTPADGAAGVVPPVFDGPPIRYGVTSYGDEEVIHATHDPLCRHLETRLERPVELVIIDDHELSTQIESGDLTFLALSPVRYIEQKGEHPELHIVARASNPGGDSYVGQIFVRPDSGIENLSGLIDKDMCFPGRDSTSGYLYPAALFRRASIDPESDFGSVHWHQGDHLETLRSLENGDCDGAAAYQNAVAEAGFATQTFHVIASTGRIPYDAYVMAPGVDGELARDITDVLLSLTPGNREATAVFEEDAQLLGFTEATDEDYDEAREIIGFVDNGTH